MKTILCVLALCLLPCNTFFALGGGAPYPSRDPSEFDPGYRPSSPHQPLQPPPPDGDRGGKITLSADGVELKDLLVEHFARRLDIEFLYDPNLLAGKKVNLSSLEVSDDKLLSILETILAYYNLSLVHPADKEQKFYKIISAQNAIKRNTPLYVFSKSEDLPFGSQMITVIFYLRHAHSGVVLNAVRPLLGEMTGGIDGGGGVVIIVDRADNVQRISAVIQAMDVKGPDSEVFVHKLKYARAEILARKLEMLINARAISAASAGRPRHGATMGASKVVHDSRTNSIILSGNTGLIELAKIIIKELDVRSDIERVMEFYTLENTSAAEIAYTLGEMLDADVSASYSGGGGSDSSEGEGLKDRGEVSKRQSTRYKRMDPQGVGQSIIDEIPMIIPETSLNQLIIIAPPKEHAKIREALKLLDVRKPQVLIEVAIVEITDDDEFNLGVELSTMDLGFSTFGFGGSSFALSRLTDLDGNGVFDARTPLEGLSGLLAGISRKNQIPLLIHALSIRTKVNVVSTPLLLVNDNEEALFESIREEPTTELTTGETTDTISFKEYVEAGIRIKIIPAISKGEYLRLYIEQDVDSFIGASTSPGVPPPKQRNHLTTTVTVPNNKTVIIGGLTVNSETETTRGIPVLSKLPLVGWLFRSRHTGNEKTRLYLFIRPQILADKDFGDLQKVTREKQDDIKKLTTKDKQGETEDKPEDKPKEKLPEKDKAVPEPARPPKDDEGSGKPEKSE